MFAVTASAWLTLGNHDHRFHRNDHAGLQHGVAIFTQFEAMLQIAIGARVQIVRPFEHLSKSHVLELGRELPLELTFSCIAPVDGQHCGHCNKCAERRRGFAELGLIDRTRYHQDAPHRL